jgi:hypothetical protein
MEPPVAATPPDPLPPVPDDGEGEVELLQPTTASAVRPAQRQVRLIVCEWFIEWTLLEAVERILRECVWPLIRAEGRSDLAIARGPMIPRPPWEAILWIGGTSAIFLHLRKTPITDLL